ncbi:MAG: hypothetical protein HZA46_03070 [Planctomycetales bacterium]|nr:hypothetical protein [Planctomycetales bacterium]
MFRFELTAQRRSSLWMSLVVVVCGCGRASQDSFIPPATSARSALETALKAWQSGAAYDTIKSATPAVQPFDARWQSGMKLKSFEILREVPQEGPKKFEVRVELEGAEAVTDVFLVVGKDPLHVFRDQDYQKASGVGGESP